MDSSTISPLSFDELCAGLRRGDFSRLAPAFGDPSAPERAVGLVVDWLEAGRFRGEPDVLAEALTCAAWLGQTGVAERLLAAGVPSVGGAATGMNALHWAANRGELASVELLLAHGAPTEIRNMYGGTALGTAVWGACHEPRGNQLGVVRALLAAGADVTVLDRPTGHAAIDALLADHDEPP